MFKFILKSDGRKLTFERYPVKGAYVDDYNNVITEGVFTYPIDTVVMDTHCNNAILYTTNDNKELAEKRMRDAVLPIIQSRKKFFEDAEESWGALL